MKKVVTKNPETGVVESVQITMSNEEWDQTEFHKRYVALVRAEIEKLNKNEREAEAKWRRERGLPPIYRCSAAA